MHIVSKSVANSAYATDINVFDKFYSEAKQAAPDAVKSIIASAELGEPTGTQKQRDTTAKAIMSNMFKAGAAGDFSKAGVTTALGYNFYDLRGPAYLIYPVNTPKVNSIRRTGRVNDGFGTAAHWKATRNVGSVYAGVAEVNRVGVSTPDEVDYMAAYKDFGVERFVSDDAVFAGEGFTNNLADEHLRELHSLKLQEESMIWLGNSGDVSNGLGFQLGQTNAPVVATTSGGNIGTSKYVFVYCVAVSALGIPNNSQYGYVPPALFPSVANGLTPSWQYQTPITGTTVTVNGGTAQISAVSTPASAGSNTGASAYTASVTPKNGEAAYAWYVDIEASNTTVPANALLYAITYVPKVTITATPAGTQTATATGLNSDHSYNSTDFSGYLTLSAVTSGAYYVNLSAGAGTGLLTPGKNGTIQEFESALEYIWSNYQASVQTIWMSNDVIQAVNNAILYSGSSSAAMGIRFTSNEQGGLTGGFVVREYLSRYCVGQLGGTAIKLAAHPMLPMGTVFFDIEDNPYPQSRIPATSELLVRRDYTAEEWPRLQRGYAFGIYMQEVLAHYTPWIQGIITGITGYNSSL